MIEFHDVEKNLVKIERFRRKLDLELVHIHANNFGGLSYNKIPNVLEITFSRYHKKNKFDIKLPHILDRPNNKLSSEIEILFQ